MPSGRSAMALRVAPGGPGTLARALHPDGGRLQPGHRLLARRAALRAGDGWVTGERSNGSWELLRIGVANIVASGFGAIPSGLNLGASTANHRAGGRSRLAAIIAAGVILLAVVLLGSLIAFLPRVVIAGMLLLVGIQLFDGWSLGHLARLFAGERAHWRAMGLDLFVVLLVA